MKVSRVIGAALLPLLSTFINFCDGSTVVGIDFGSQFIKVAYVASGQRDPTPMILNDMTERKTLNAIAYRGGKVFVGPHSVKPSIQNPKRAYKWLKMMLGRQFEDGRVQELLQDMSAIYSRDPETGLVLGRAGNDDDDDEEGKVPLENLTAILFSKLKEQSSAYSGKSVTDAVIAIPPYFTQSQRTSVIRAAQIAGLNVKSLSTDISVAALYYAQFLKRSSGGGGKTKVEDDAVDIDYFVMFDSGAGHSSASLNRFTAATKTLGAKLEVIKSVSDQDFHGLAIDRAIAALIERKNAANGGVAIPRGRAHIRLMDEVSRVKLVLTVNEEATATLDEFVEGHSLKITITREELERECKPYLRRSSALIQSLFEGLEEEISIDQIQAIIPLGGNNRVPFVKRDLEEAFGKTVQAVVDMDEVVATGATWMAALMTRFRIKNAIEFKDAYADPISLAYHIQDESKHLEVFPAHSQTDAHKGIAFKDVDKIDFTVVGKGEGSLFKARISGVEKAVSDKFADKELSSKKLKFWIDLDASGMLSVDAKPVALVTYEREQEKKETSTKQTSGPEPTAPASENPSEPTETLSESTQTTTSKAPEMETITVQDTAELKLEIESLIPQVSLERVQKLREALFAAIATEKAAIHKSTIKNEIESKFYELSELVEEADFVAYMTDSELKELKKNIEATSIQLEDRKDHPTAYYEDHLAALVGPVKPAEYRMAQEKARTQAVKALNKEISISLDWAASKRLDTSPQRPQSLEDLSEIEGKANELSEWLTTSLAAQKKLAPSQDPPILAKIFEDKLRRFSQDFKKIKSKVYIAPPPPPPSEENENDQEKGGSDEDNAQNKDDQSQNWDKIDGATEYAKEASIDKEEL